MPWEGQKGREYKEDVARFFTITRGHVLASGPRTFGSVPEALRDNFTKAQKALGIRHRSLYQAKHTYAVLSLLAGESPAVIARNLGISLATLEKHYAAALQKGRTIAMENAVRRSKTPRAVSDGVSTRTQKPPRRDLILTSRA